MLETRETRNAVLYGRISDEKQLGNSSLSHQETTIQHYAAALDYVIDQAFKDKAVSAKQYAAHERPGMRDLVYYVLGHPEIKGIFFYDLSRLSRQYYDFKLYVVNPIKAYRPEMKYFDASTRREVDFYDAMSVTGFALAKLENEYKSARAIDQQKAMIHSHLRPAGRIN